MTGHNLSVLPPEIIETILLRLPAKPLLRFKTVCKSWNTIISDSRFINSHLNQSRYSNSQNLFIRKYICFELGFSLVEFKGGKLQTLVEEFDEPYHWKYIYCVYKGMLLLGNCHSRKYCLWNPSARKVMKFWFPYIFKYNLGYGICYDRISGDFKVIFTSTKFYAVFSCKNKTWSKKKDYVYGPLQKSSVVCAHDVVYWETGVNNTTEITYYDPVEDDFFILDRPGGVEKRIPVYIVELGGYLGLYCNWRDEKTIRIWKRDHTCWRWEEWVTFENVPTSIFLFRPLCLVEDKIVIKLVDHKKLVRYSPNSKTYEEIDQDARIHFVRLVPYVESLLCPIQNTRLERKRKFRF